VYLVNQGEVSHSCPGTEMETEVIFERYLGIAAGE
jgi:hypothetical protein